ncbi:MAG: hypothetical protein CMF74_01535 [Maricaulis sp.]|jgi:hypothetical protein|nr:hypothetical protein [Maricaulis sp.]|tara:strand:- start:2554 stop:2784 length:231 start_codon:yes stop_codon:yes gene_type:complete
MKSVDFNVHEVMKVCFDNDIKIYPVIYDKNHLQLEINYKGKKKRGQELYNQKTDQKKMQQKIGDLYYHISEKLTKC